MKHLYILITVLLFACSSAQAGWFSKAPDPTIPYKEKITALENQLTTQAQVLDRWQITAGTLGIACVVLFVFGTALGSITRKHYDSPATRMGPGGRTPSPNLNNTKARFNGKGHHKNGSASLATSTSAGARS